MAENLILLLLKSGQTLLRADEIFRKIYFCR